MGLNIYKLFKDNISIILKNNQFLNSYLLIQTIVYCYIIFTNTNYIFYIQNCLKIWGLLCIF